MIHYYDVEVIILAMPEQRRTIERFDMHLSSTRRNRPRANIQVVYTSNLLRDISSITDIPRIVVVCLNSKLMSMIDNHMLQAIFRRAVLLVPFVLQDCLWDVPYSPFYNHKPLTIKPLSAVSNKERLFVEAVQTLEEVIDSTL